NYSADRADIRNGVQESREDRDAGSRRNLEQHESDGVQHAHEHRNQELPANVGLKNSSDFIEKTFERLAKARRDEAFKRISPRAEVHEDVIHEEGNQEQNKRSV